MSNMNIIDIQNATTLSKTNQPPANSADELGKNDFLNLLMAQLGSQDPLQPTDNEAFIQQLTAFANLEELQNVSKSFEDLIGITSAGNQATMVTLLGKDVRVGGDEFNGPEAKLHYDLPKDAKEAQIEIRGENGEVIRVIEDIPLSEGAHTIDVDGLEDEKLKFSVIAKDFEDQEIEATQSVSEQVTGVNFGREIPVLLTKSGREIPATEIYEIFERENSSEASAEAQDSTIENALRMIPSL